MAKPGKSKRPRKSKLEKRLAESKGLYYRRVLDGGCVLIQSDYWFARAGKPEGPPPVLEQPTEERPPAIPSDPKDRWLAETQLGCPSIQGQIRIFPAMGHGH
jgi:hypothetical protein